MIRKTYTTLLLMSCLMGGFIPNAVAESPQAAAKAPSLYTQLGGYDAIAAVCDDLLPRMKADSQLGRFWKNRGKDGMRREQQLLVDFLCTAAGGPLAPFAGNPLLPYVVGACGINVHGEILGGLVSASAWADLSLRGPVPTYFEGTFGLKGCVAWVLCASVSTPSSP